MTDPWEREREELENDYAEGLITYEEFNRQMREINLDSREAMHDAALTRAKEAVK